MKKVVILICFVVFVYTNAFSQGFTFNRISAPIVYNDTSWLNVTKTKGVTKNTSSSPITFKAVRLLNNIPIGWSTSMCGFGNCFASTEDTIPPRGQAPAILQPGQTDTLEIDFYGLTYGTGTVIIKMAKADNMNGAFILDTFKVTLRPVGIINISSIVKDFELKQNYPNPFNPNTSINFSLPKTDVVRLSVYDMLGREVAVLLNGEKLNQGSYKFDFNADDFNLTSGVYIYKLSTGDFQATKKMILVK